MTLDPEKLPTSVDALSIPPHFLSAKGHNGQTTGAITVSAHVCSAEGSSLRDLLSRPVPRRTNQSPAAH